MTAVAQLSLHTPIGDISVSEDNGFLVALDWGWGRNQVRTHLLTEAKRQLHVYFHGALTQFDLPLRPSGTVFQRTVWMRMLKIPYGRTDTYGNIAKRLNSSARAVGNACGRNPLPIFIPCHRVIGANSALGGYSGTGGLATKTALLVLEGTDVQPLKQNSGKVFYG